MVHARLAHLESAHGRPLLRVRVFGLGIILTLTLMGAFAGVAQAAPVTGLTVDPLSPSAAGGARTVYVIHFTTNAALAAGQHITITLPSGASVRTDINSSVTVGGVNVGSCGIGSSDDIAICTVASGKSIGATTAVTVELDGATNPPVNPTGGQQQLSLATDADTPAATANYTVVTPAPVSSPTVTNTPPTTAAGGRTVYTIGFTTSRTGGGMSGKAHSQITVTLPGNTSVRTDINSSVTAGGVNVGSCGIGSSDNIAICTIASNSSIGANTAVTVELDGVTNESPAPAKNADLLTVATTSDTQTSTSGAFPIVAAQSVSQPTVTNTPPTTAAGGRTVYTIGFTTSSAGGMSGKAHSQITVTLPGNTSVRTDINSSVTAGGVNVGSCGIGPSDNIAICTIGSSSSIGANTAVTVELDGVTNESPAPAKNADLLTVATTSDTLTSTSGAFPIVAAQSVSPPTVTNTPPTTAAGGRTVYTIGFTTSSTGGMSGKAHSQITVTLPGNTSVRTDINSSVTAGGANVGSCGIGSTDNVAICTIGSSSSIGANTAVTVELDGVTNESPARTGGTDTLTVSTTSDTPASASSTFPIVAAQSVSPPTVTNTPPTTAAGGRTVYTISFTTSSTGGMSGKAHSQITVTLPGNTSVRTDINSSVTAGGVNVGSCGIGSTDNIAICTIGSNSTVGANTAVTVELDGVTNESPAPTGGTDTLTVSTTSDTQAIASGTFPIVAARSVSQPTVRLSNVTPGAHANYTVAFTTSASGGGMSGKAHSQITITLPGNTSVRTDTNSSVTVGGVNVGSCGIGSSDNIAICTIASNSTVGANTGVTVELDGVTNPSNVSTSSTLSVQTTSDTSGSTSSPYQGGGTQPPTVSGISPTSGPTSGGTSVTITGTNLTGATAVNFGSAGATNVAVLSSTQITATSPPGSGTVDVTVTTAGGTSATSSSDQFTYIAPTPTPTPTPTPSPTPAPPSTSPAVSGGAPSSSTGNGATLAGTVNPESLATTAYFQYGLDPSFRGPGSSSTLYDQSTPPQQIGADSAVHNVSASLTGLVPGALYHVRLVATNSAGTTLGPDQTFTTAKAAAPPPPVLGQSADAQPVSGTVFIRTPSGAFVRLTGAQQIPSGAVIDATRGTLKITTALPGGAGARDAAAKSKHPTAKAKTQSGSFGGAIFKITQAHSGLTNLSLIEGAFSGAPSYALCKAHKAADASIASTKTLQLLKASAHGKFRTSGRYSAATVRGTVWTVADRCDGTLTHVITDSVAVTDLVHHRTIVLHGGQSYLAKAPKP